MTMKRSSLTQIFLRGIGLKTTLSYIPPIAVAWTFFILYLRGLPSAAAARLAEQSARLKREVESFLGQVRSA